MAGRPNRRPMEGTLNYFTDIQILNLEEAEEF